MQDDDAIDEVMVAEAVAPEAAAFWRRAMAHLVDTAIFVLANIVMQLTNPEENRIAVSVSTSAGLVIYKMLMEWHYGYTWGKRIFKVRVTDAYGGRITSLQAVYRQLPFIVLSVFGSLNTVHVLPALEKAGTMAEKQVVLQNSPYYAGFAASAVIWWGSCILVALRRDKRAGHDLLAGTRCVRMVRDVTSR